MTFVIKRKIDELGRLVLPIDHRNHYGITAGDPLLITETGNGILVRKAPEYTDEVKIVDELGRVVIPKRIREDFNLEAKSVLAILATENGILLKPLPSSSLPATDLSTWPIRNFLSWAADSRSVKRDFPLCRKSVTARAAR